jgi:hypothetical protein
MTFTASKIEAKVTAKSYLAGDSQSLRFTRQDFAQQSMLKEAKSLYNSGSTTEPSA